MLKWLENNAPIRQKVRIIILALLVISVVQFAVDQICDNFFFHQEGAQIIAQIAGVILQLAFTLIIGSYAIRIIAVPFERITSMTERVAEGYIDSSVPYGERTDCSGRLARSLYKFIDSSTKQIKAQEEAAALAKKNIEAQEIFSKESERIRHLQSKTIENICAGMSIVIKGDLTFRFEEPFQEKFEDFRQDFNKLINTYRTSISQIASGAIMIDSGLSEISTAAEDLAERTDRQAANIAQSAISVNSITERVRESARASAQAREAAIGTREEAKAAATVMHAARDAMDAISASSRRVEAIVGVMEEMAFQTNILALNAGVEAARAGEAGRGFDVVAKEIRSLAHNSARSAKEIKSLILQAGEQVSQGVKLVGDTDSVIGNITTNVTRITKLLDGISSATSEQAQSLSEINSAIAEMDQATQRNAAMVEETSTASRSLTGEARELARVVRQFTFQDDASSEGNHQKPAHEYRQEDTFAHHGQDHDEFDYAE